MKSWFHVIWQFRATVALVLLVSTLIWAGKDDADPDEGNGCGDDMLICSLVKFGILEPNPRSWNPGPGLPLAFEPNLGQAGSTVEFLARASNSPSIFRPAMRSSRSMRRTARRSCGPRWKALRRARRPSRRFCRARRTTCSATTPRSGSQTCPRSGASVTVMCIPASMSSITATPENWSTTSSCVPAPDPSRIRMALHGAAAMSLNAEGDIMVHRRRA